MNMGMDIAVDGSDGTETVHETMSVAVSGNGRIQMILKDPLQLAISMNMNMESNTAGAGPDVTMQDQVSVQEWMQDGWVYVQEEMDGTTDRYKYPVGDMDGFAEFYQEMLQISGQIVCFFQFQHVENQFEIDPGEEVAVGLQQAAHHVLIHAAAQQVGHNNPGFRFMPRHDLLHVGFQGNLVGIGAQGCHIRIFTSQPAHRAGQSGGVFAMTRDQIFHIIPLSIRPFQCHYRKLCNH